MSRQASTGSWIGAIVVVLAIVAGGAYLVHKALHPAAPNAPTSTLPAAPASTANAPVPIQHPIADAAPASAATAPLPALDDSDDSVASALAALAGSGDLRSLLRSSQLITRIVATVDALPRHELGTLMLPLRTPKGSFVTAEADGRTVIAEQNAERYAPYMQIVESADPHALVAWYVHAYPLFQQAYRQLGYPHGYFNDRLFAAIDDMLAAPEPSQPPALVRAKAFYAYADPALESLSAGQRLLLRTGPANEAKIKAKLRAIRSELTGQQLPASAGTTSH